MSCPEPYTSFKGVSRIGDSLVMDSLELNLKNFFDYSFLQIGGFINVVQPSAISTYGGNFSNLKMSADPNYPLGTVYEGIRKDWVWETGVSYEGSTPVNISGIWVNGKFFLSSDTHWGHYIDYPNGRVVFNNPVPKSSGVALNYSYRFVQTYIPERVPWFYEGEYESFFPSGNQWNISFPNSGDFNAGPEHRFQFPAIIIECVPNGGTQNRPYELGNTALWVTQDVICNIISDTRQYRNKLTDILRLEDNHVIWLYDNNAAISGNYLPLDYRGALINTSGIYPNLVNNFQLAKCYFKHIQISEVESKNPKLFESKVRISCEIVVGKL